MTAKWQYKQAYEGALEEARSLAADNARIFSLLKHESEQTEKLRELVRHMHTCMEHYESDGSVSCDRCPLDNDTGDCDYERRMSELGIGVSADA